MDERVGAGRRQQPGEQRVADVGLEELGPLELRERRGRIEADHVLDAGIALETERELGSPVGSDAGDQYPAPRAHLIPWIPLLIGFQRTILNLR